MPRTHHENAIIRLEKLWYKYPMSEDWVLKGINLSIKPREFVCITGPSGCGKSTLLYCLNGIIPHAIGGELEGEIVVDGSETRELNLYEISKSVALVQQDPENQIRTLTVMDEVAFGPENLLIPKDEILERIKWALRMVKASDLLNRETAELSGGQKQRIAIASALAMKPKVLVLDEPTSNIDPKAAAEIVRNLRDIHASTDITIVVVEHKLDLFLPIANRLVVMNEGRIISDEASRSLLAKQKDIFLKIGIRPPQIFELFMKLKELDFIYPSAFPLTIEAAARMLREKLREKFVCVCSPRNEKSPRELGEVIVKVENLTFTYPNGFRALDGVNLNVRRGEFVGIIGNNGSGKTTFLLHLMGILKPEKGRVIVFDMDTKKTSISKIARKIGIVFQYPSHQLFEDTVVDELLFAPRNFGMSKETVSQRVKDMLKMADLEGLEDRYPQSLSVGQMKRLNLASVLIYDPDLLILDEPFLGQDYGNVKRIMNLLNRLNKSEGKTIIIVSHAITELAEYVDRLVLFDSGKIIEDGPTRQVMSKMSEKYGFFCTPICRLARLLAGRKIENLPFTISEMISALETAR